MNLNAKQSEESKGGDDKSKKSDNTAAGQQGAEPTNPEDDREKRSIFVKNVHFSANKEEIEE